MSSKLGFDYLKPNKSVKVTYHRGRGGINLSDHHFHKQKNSTYTVHDLLKGKDLDIIAASLLLLGKLKVESVQLFRNSPTIGVTLIGKYKNLKDDTAEKNMSDFLDENGDMTLDEVFEELSKRMNKKRM